MVETEKGLNSNYERIKALEKTTKQVFKVKEEVTTTLA